MTDSKLVVIDALANAAMRKSIAQDDEELSNPLEDFERVLGKPARIAAGLIPPQATKPPKLTDARSAATLQRAALAVMVSSANPAEEATRQALEAAGLNRELFAQAIESPDWVPTIARLLQQYSFAVAMPAIISAQIQRAKVGDVQSAKLLFELFGRSDLDRLDETTKALSEASPETLARHTQGLLDDLQSLLNEASGKGADVAAVEQARAAAIASANTRKGKKSR